MKRILLCIGFVSVMVLPLSACGSPSTSSNSAATSTPTTQKPAQPLSGTSVMIDGKSYQIPTNQNGAPPSSRTDSGTNVVVTSSGVLPSLLIAPKNAVITFTNLSPRPIRISTTGISEPPSSLIPTGGTYTYSSPGRSFQFGYKTSSGFLGIVQVGLFSGE